jgi:Zn-finger nucleic acid-binding protein
MQCPKCNAEMEEVYISGLTVQRCTDCFGLWFDRFKHEYLKADEDASDIDVGDPKTGKSYDKLDRVFCPDCQAPMIRMVDAAQPHLHYESCSKCFSVFFDAGEFRDYVEKDIIDFFKDLFARERK